MSTFPFAKDDGKKKYTCFICGVVYLEFDEFTEHIIENHEEGKDYVRCPLERCQACVRCLKTHFKSKHPTITEIPKIGQMRAIVWKDQTQSKGKLKTRTPKFRQGYLISTKNGGKEMHYRSGLECDVYECLEEMKEVIAYDVEPFKVQYAFHKDAKDKTGIHEYNPDLRIVFDDGHAEIWEIKPSDQTHLPINQAKWVACKQHCDARGMGFMVLTEKGLGQLKQKIKGQS